MKKNFSLTEPNKKPDRVVEAIKAEVNKYLARERRKALPKDVDYWDFDCRVGEGSDSAKVVHVKELSKSIDEVAQKKVPSVYIEILAKPGYRVKRNLRDSEEFDDER